MKKQTDYRFDEEDEESMKFINTIITGMIWGAICGFIFVVAYICLIYFNII